VKRRHNRFSKESEIKREAGERSELKGGGGLWIWDLCSPLAQRKLLGTGCNRSKERIQGIGSVKACQNQSPNVPFGLYKKAIKEVEGTVNVGSLVASNFGQGPMKYGNFSVRDEEGIFN